MNNKKGAFRLLFYLYELYEETVSASLKQQEV